MKKDYDRELKTQPEPFYAIVNGLKRHEIRVEDGPRFEVNETILLREFVSYTGRRKGGKYTGQVQRVRVSYITRGPEWGIPAGLVVLSIFPLEPGDA